MKRIITILLAAVMLCLMTATAYATEPAGEPPVPSVVVLSEEPKVSAAPEDPAILRDVRLVNENGQNLLIKTWEVPAGYDPERLTEC